MTNAVSYFLQYFMVAFFGSCFMTGPDRVGATGDGEGPLVLVTEASFGAVRSLSTVRETLFVACMRWPTAHMLYTYRCGLVAFFNAVY